MEIKFGTTVYTIPDDELTTYEGQQKLIRLLIAEVLANPNLTVKDKSRINTVLRLLSLGEKLEVKKDLRELKELKDKLSSILEQKTQE